jgi:hypothetical protein
MPRKALANDEMVADAERWLKGVQAVNVYCYEPAPSTFTMLENLYKRLVPVALAKSSAELRAHPPKDGKKAYGQWILKNLGFTNVRRAQLYSY